MAPATTSSRRCPRHLKSKKERFAALAAPTPARASQGHGAAARARVLLAPATGQLLLFFTGRPACLPSVSPAGCSSLAFLHLGLSWPSYYSCCPLRALLSLLRHTRWLAHPRGRGAPPRRGQHPRGQDRRPPAPGGASPRSNRTTPAWMAAGGAASPPGCSSDCCSLACHLFLPAWLPPPVLADGSFCRLAASR